MMAFTTEPQRHRETEKDPLTGQIIASAIEVHKAMGPGLLESVYEDCLCHELQLRGIAFRRQLPVPLSYKGLKLDAMYRIDILVEDRVIVELKATDRMLPISCSSAQLLTPYGKEGSVAHQFS